MADVARGVERPFRGNAFAEGVAKIWRTCSATIAARLRGLRRRCCHSPRLVWMCRHPVHIIHTVAEGLVCALNGARSR